MKMYKVESVQIHSVGYNHKTNKLRVRFIHTQRSSSSLSSTYEYHNVTPAMYNEIRCASSVGSYFNRAIKRFPEAYPYTRLLVSEVQEDSYEDQGFSSDSEPDSDSSSGFGIES